MEWIAANIHWTWLIVGIALMIMEIFGASGYLLVAGISAATVALATYVVPDLELKWQLLIFGADLVVCAVAVTLWFRTRDKASLGVDVGKPGVELIGKIVVLQNDLENYESRIRIHDANWDVTSAIESLEAGTRVTIIDVKGRALIVQQV